MLKSLEKERAIAIQHVEKLDRVIASLHAVNGRGPGRSVGSPRKLSAAGRKAISEAAKRRWRNQKREQRAQAKQKKTG